MHSRLFVLSKESTPKDYYLPFREQPYYISNMVDSIFPSETFREDIKDLEERYRTRVLYKDGVAMLSKNSVAQIKEKVDEFIKIRLDNIEKMLSSGMQRNAWMLYEIASVAWMYPSYTFSIVETCGVGNIIKEVELPELLEDANYYIVEIYDFHF